MVQDKQPQFVLQRIYVKDLSFESPKVPEIFQVPWQPEVKVDLNTTNRLLHNDIYEVILSLTITVQNDSTEDKITTLLAEVQQAGIFYIKGFRNDKLHKTLIASCPNILFPYAREAIDNMVLRGSFPPLMLAPVNFDVLFARIRS